MNAPDPLPVEMLVTDEQRRLADALGSARPLPASSAEECGELLRRRWQKQAKEIDGTRTLQLLYQISQERRSA